MKGYTNHFWNGITCLQFAKVCEYMIENDLFWMGVKHITSPHQLTKLHLVRMVSKIYKLNLRVRRFTPPVKCDRTLSSVRKDINIEIPPLDKQIEEMRDFNKILTGE